MTDNYKEQSQEQKDLRTIVKLKERINNEIRSIKRISDDLTITVYEDDKDLWVKDNCVPQLSILLCRDKISHNFYTVGLQYNTGVKYRREYKESLEDIVYNMSTHNYREYNEDDECKKNGQIQRRFCAKCGNYRRLFREGTPDYNKYFQSVKTICQCYGEEDVDVGLCVFDYFKMSETDDEYDSESNWDDEDWNKLNDIYDKYERREANINGWCNDYNYENSFHEDDEELVNEINCELEKLDKTMKEMDDKEMLLKGEEKIKRDCENEDYYEDDYYCSDDSIEDSLG